MNKVIVVGSVNMDITARTDKLPDTGETVAARSVEYLPGGKGLNQAVAAAKIGTTVVLAGCFGSDSFADELASFIRRHKIDVSCLRRSEKNHGQYCFIRQIKLRFIHLEAEIIAGFDIGTAQFIKQTYLFVSVLRKDRG